MASTTGAQLTCLTCKVIFASGELQRNHYRCDWHRYNLKRKVASLPPVTAEDFAARVLAQKASQAAAQADVEKAHCRDCKKAFASAQALQNHLQSKRHLEVLKKAAQNGVASSSDSSEAAGAPPTQDGVPLTNGSTNGQATAHIRRSNRPPRIYPPTTEAMLLTDVAPAVAAAQDDNEEEWEDLNEEGMEEDDEGDSTDGDGPEENSREEGKNEESAEQPLPMEPELADCIPPHVCLFCNKVSANLDTNMDHMARHHSFFVPDTEYLVDLEGLIKYLGYKVGAMKVCLLCDTDQKTPFRSLLAVQQHMLDCGHTAMYFDCALEYAEFFDYSATHPDGTDPDEEFDPELLQENEDWTLQLPSGAYIGHRSLMRYYRQRLGPERPVNQRRRGALLFQKYKALGWTNAPTKEQAVMKARDQRFAQRLRHSHEMRLGVKANKMQHHFRQQVLF